MDADLRANAHVIAQVSEAVEGKSLPQAYYGHPIVREHSTLQAPVVPLALFVDGAPYSHTDGVVGFWVINTVTEKRVLVAAMRKKLACSCGCRGWCSYHAILSFLA